MAIRIKSRGGESVHQLLRRFKKLCEKEGLTKDIKRKQYYEKPSERRRRAQRKTEQRLARLRAGVPVRPRPTSSRRGGGRR
jgi:small subunit ribosomal protein S21